MTREQRKKKLANAVRAYRGAMRGGRWVRPPERRRVDQMIVWLQRLSLPVMASLARIDAFASYDEFHNWIKDL